MLLMVCEKDYIYTNRNINSATKNSGCRNYSAHQMNMMASHDTVSLNDQSYISALLNLIAVLSFLMFLYYFGNIME
jgi:hypothetical protein